MIDSGSRDRSREIARAAGVELLEIAPGGVRARAHPQPGRRAHERRADLLPDPGRDAGARAGSPPTARRSRSTRASAPPTARTCREPDTSPMIARELTEFFAGFAPDGRPRVQRAGDASFLSNVNACYARACWEEIRFRDVAYAEDQAFGARPARRRLDEGLPPRRRRAARARLRRARVHAPLLRRVPRPARDHRPRRAAAPCAACSGRSARTCAG